MEVLEANKTANKEEIKRLRDENKELRQKLATLQRSAAKDEVQLFVDAACPSPSITSPTICSILRKITSKSILNEKLLV